MRTPDDLLPLTPAVLHILLALADGEKHGYAIMQEVEKLSAGQVGMGPGTLYGSIKRMLQTGLIVETEQRPAPDQDDERRRYYRLSDFGIRVLEAEARRLELLLAATRRKLILRGEER
jgi:DNA-binding PadR family transcriptional regulator